MKETIMQIKALPDDIDADFLGGVFVYNRHGSQIDEFSITDLKALVCRLERLEADVLQIKKGELENDYKK